MTGDLILNGDPTADLQAATKQYVDGVAAGLDWKESVRVATTAAITLSGEQTIDGIGVVAGDRVLVKNQGGGASDVANGIYVCAAGAWARSPDADEDSEVTAGMAMFVEEGTANADTAWVLVTNNPITLGITALQFSTFSSPGSYTAGTGLTESPARTFNVDFEDTDGNIQDVGTQAAGTSDKVARADHVHAHGDQAGGTLHDLATTSVAGFLSASDKEKLDAILAGLDAGTLAGQTLIWDGTDTWTPTSDLFVDEANNRVGVNTVTPHSTLHAEGSVAHELVTVTASYDLTTGDNQHVKTIIVNNAAAATIALPSAVGISGREYRVKKVSATGGGRTVTIDPNGAETIDGAADFDLVSQYESITFVSDGANWWIV
jgi:phage-related tail fiber protein